MNMMMQTPKIVSAICVEVLSSPFLSLPHNSISSPMGSEIKVAEFKEPHLKIGKILVLLLISKGRKYLHVLL